MPHDNRTRLEPGTRVRAVWQQFPRAYAEGTATITEVVKQHQIDSTWEYLVLTGDGEVRSWNIVDTVDAP